jgi:hypothetical protein
MHVDQQATALQHQHSLDILQASASQQREAENQKVSFFVFFCLSLTYDEINSAETVA